MSDDTFLPLPDNFGGRVRIHPNAADSVYVDASSNSANGKDNDEHVHFVTYRGNDYTSSGNWTRAIDGTWTTNYPKVSKRASFGTARAPKTYEAAINQMIADGLEAWYENGGRAATLRAALKNAHNELSGADAAVLDAQQALSDALEAQEVAVARLADAEAAVLALQS